MHDRISPPKKLDKKILNIMFQEQKGRKTKVSRQRFDTSVSRQWFDTSVSR
jgi:hypothetical protein